MDAGSRGWRCPLPSPPRRHERSPARPPGKPLQTQRSGMAKDPRCSPARQCPAQPSQGCPAPATGTAPFHPPTPYSSRLPRLPRFPFLPGPYGPSGVWSRRVWVLPLSQPRLQRVYPGLGLSPSPLIPPAPAPAPPVPQHGFTLRTPGQTGSVRLCSDSLRVRLVPRAASAQDRFGRPAAPNPRLGDALPPVPPQSPGSRGWGSQPGSRSQPLTSRPREFFPGLALAAPRWL